MRVRSPQGSQKDILMSDVGIDEYALFFVFVMQWRTCGSRESASARVGGSRTMLYVRWRPFADSNSAGNDK